MTEKLALITGASRGLGAGLAEILAPEYHIVAVGRTTGALEEIDDLIQAQGGSATLAPMDITETAAMAQLCKSVYERWGKCDMWLHTAIHAAPLAPVNHIDAKDLGRSVKVNVEATAQLIAFVAPLLGQTGDAVFFDDPGARGKFFGAYGASKAAQMALVRSWQAETIKTGPRVHIVMPQPMPTATRARFFPGEDRDALNPPKQEAVRLLRELKNLTHS